MVGIVLRGMMDGEGKQTKPFYIACLDGMRAIAFLLVFAGHAGWGRIIPGGLGVTIFFFLSGYLITTLLRLESGNTGSISVRGFYVRRALRILPPLYLILGSGFVLGALGGMRCVSGGAAYLAAMTFTTNYYSMFPIALQTQSQGMETVWSLCVEEHFYLLFPMLFLYFLRKGIAARKQVAILLCMCALALVWRIVVVVGLHNITTGDSPKWSYTTTDCRFDSILWGVMLAIFNNPWFGDRPHGALARHRGLFACMGMAGIVLSLLYRDPVFRETMRYTVQGIALYPIFHYCIATDGRWPVRVLEWQPLRWMGELSYTLYLCHLYVLKEIYVRYPDLGRHNTAFLALSMSILIAWVMRKTVELPLRNTRRAWREPRALAAEMS